jgi:HD-like signal output (HDOD) protein
MTPAPAGSVKETILRLAQRLPTSPQIFSRLCLLLNDDNADLGKVVNLISIDAGLTARVIRLSNSVFFRGSSSIQSLDEAINRVGFREVHKMVGVAMTEQVFKDGLPAYGLTGNQIWESSVATALSMERLSRHAGEDEHIAYTVGLLRQIGKLVLGRILEKEHPGAVCPDDMEVETWERARVNISSHEATAYILEAWKMPPHVHSSVRHHHQPEIAPTDGSLGAQLHLSCWIVNTLGHGLKAEAPLWELTDDRLEMAGVSQEVIQECVSEISNDLADLKKQLGM